MRDPTAAEMRRFLKKRHGAEAEDFDIEQAIYWFASDWHGGQSSNLYSALSTSDYRPGRSERGPEDGSHAAIMYADLEDQYGKRRQYTGADDDRRRMRGNPALPKVGTPIVGYSSGAGRISDAKGRFTGWVEYAGVETYNAGEAWEWQKARAVVVAFHPSTRKKMYYGAGLSLGSGMLFRGEVVGYDFQEAKRQAKIEAEHWLERDNEDEEREDYVEREDDE